MAYIKKRLENSRVLSTNLKISCYKGFAGYKNHVQNCTNYESYKQKRFKAIRWESKLEDK